MVSKKDEQDITDVMKNEGKELALADITNVGTEEISQEDLNTPNLKIIQSNTQDVEDKKEGAFYRSDTRETLDEVLVNLVYVTTTMVENYNKTGQEKVKIYFGFYEGTNEPFKMYVRGWSLNGHRNFQSEVGMMKNKFKVPMLALKVNLSTEKQQGTIPESGKPYTIHKLKFDVAKDTTGAPVLEEDPRRIGFLVEAAQKFKQVAMQAEAENGAGEPLPFGQES